MWEGELPDDAGPANLSVEQRRASKFDRVVPIEDRTKWKNKNKTKDELIEEILNAPNGSLAGDRKSLKKKLLGELQEIAEKAGISKDYFCKTKEDCGMVREV
mmetsp:Transcript_21/g.40  ORF Transcript_21/g.40 Transcript_21/m.40 type:complete len:102 (+) Transcript_21:2-307(+)